MKKLFVLMITAVLALSPMMSAGAVAMEAAPLKSSTVSYAVEGGNIRFDPTTGKITRADKTVTNVVIPSSIEGVTVTGIGEWAFYEIPTLKSVTIPETVEVIDKGAFYGCTALETLVIPEGITEVSEMMCYGCTSLRRVFLPDSLKKINRLAFYECTGLKYITIPKNVETVCEMAFYACSDLKGIEFKSDSTVLERTQRGERQMEFVFWDSFGIEKVVNCPDAAWKQRLLQNRWAYQYFTEQDPKEYIIDEGEDRETYRKLAQEITAGLTTDYDRCRAIMIWVVQHVEYDEEFARTKQDRPDIHRDSKTLIADIIADGSKPVTTTCGGYTDITLSLLWALDIPATGVHRKKKEGERVDHEWGIAYLDDRWVWFDTTQSDPDDSEEPTASLNLENPDYFDPKTAGLSYSFDHRVDSIQQPNGRFEDIPEDISMPDMVNDWDDPDSPEFEDRSGSPMKIPGKDCSWNIVNGRSYWYEGGTKQGTYYDKDGVMGDGSIRGREIYDAASDGWYWLDSCYDGAKAVGKEVWVPYIYQNEAEWDDEKKREVAYESDPGMGEIVLQAMLSKAGKWVRYDENGAMLKSWVTIEGALAEKYPDQKGNTYYYDTRTGLMAKGYVTIGGREYHFDEISGVLK